MFFQNPLLPFKKIMALGWFSAKDLMEPAGIPQVNSSLRGFVTCTHHGNAEKWNPHSHLLWWSKVYCRMHIRLPMHQPGCKYMQIYMQPFGLRHSSLSQRCLGTPWFLTCPARVGHALPWRKVWDYAHSWRAWRSDLKRRIRPGTSEDRVLTQAQFKKIKMHYNACIFQCTNHDIFCFHFLGQGCLGHE